MSEAFRSSWEESYIIKYFEILIGGTPSRSNNAYWDNTKLTGNKWVSIKDIKRRYISDTEEQITDLGVKKSNVKLIPKNTVIMSFKLTIGRLTITKCPLYTNEAIVSFIPKKSNSVDTNYLYYGLQSWNLLGEVDQAVKGATLNKDKMSKILGLFPPLPEQKKIASILTTVDEVIENTQKQIDKLQDLKKATMNELLTKGIDHTEFKDSELGKIPMSWEVKTIGEFVQDYKGGAALTPSDFTNVGFPVIPKKSVQFGGKIILGFNRTFCHQRFAEANRSHIVDRQYVIATLRDLVPSGPSIGLIGVLNEDEQFVLAQGVYGFRLTEGLSKSFLSYLSNTDWYRVFMRRLMVGSTQVHIRTGEFLHTKIPVPSLSEQLEISLLIDAYENLIESKTKKLDKQIVLKKSLMQNLLTGKVRVMLN